MIRKLQLKFILICMLSLLAVLAVIIAGMNIVSYHNLVTQADEVLELLSNNRGHFPPPGSPGQKLPHHMSPEIPYESRFFTVTLDGDGKILRVDTGRIAAVGEDDARRFASLATEVQGFVEEFRYLRYADDGQVQLIFLDCGRRLDAFRDFLTNSLLISLAGYVVVFMLVLFLSQRVTRPFAETYEKQKRFITDAGHELKTPLTIIRADADVLEMELGKNEWLEDIQKQTQRLSDLTADLVFLSKTEEAQADLPMIAFPISDVVAETAQSFQAPAQTQGKELVTQIAPMLSATGNENAIAQLTSILLDNALKYSPPGTEIRLTLERQGKQLLLSVSNLSSQPLPRQLSLLFDRFYRGDSARSTQGHGIGLSIASAIAVAHGGKMSATLAGRNTLRITAHIPMGNP